MTENVAARRDTPGSAYRRLLAGDGIIVQPSIAEPLAARLAAQVGFSAISVGGYAMGAFRATTEPLLSLEDVAVTVRHIRAVCDLPMMVDAGAGWGEPMHTMHAVRTLERAGAAAIHLEDQQYPKRAHYHKGVEHTVSQQEMLAKLEAALAASAGTDLVVCARTDTMRTHGYAEGIKRAEAYAQAGADLVMMFPNNDTETRSAPGDLAGVPLVYVNSTGNSQGRGVYAADQLQEWGWKVLYDSISVSNVVYASLRRFLRHFRETGRADLGIDDLIRNRADLESTIGLDDLYELEARTVER